MDPLLLILGLLLIATLSAFFAGTIPYPFGVLVLSLLIIGRLFYLQDNK
jgi:dihydroxy-acid dehydratase